MRRGAVAAPLVALVLFPAPAAAHGLAGRADLPIPTWLFGWAAAIVLAASFAALGALWREPRLEKARQRRVMRMPDAVGVVTGVIGVALFALVVYAGLSGRQAPPEGNFAPLFIYVNFWVGVAVLSVLFGDVFRAFNPWRAVGKAASFVTGGRWRTRPYPEWLGRWPAAAGLLGFAWLELAAAPADKDDPSTLAVLALIYAAVQLAGMAAYGVEAWTTRGDAFGVYFNMLSRLSPWERREGVLYLRPPLTGVPGWKAVPGSVAFVCVTIGSTTFDGFSNGQAWADIRPDLQSALGDIGFGMQASFELASTIGLAVCVCVIALFYRLGIAGMGTVGGGHDPRELLSRFAHSLIPIAFAYALAHYFSLLLYKGQAIIYLASDPLGRGSDIFGTAGTGINYNLISGSGIYYVQVGVLVCGHVAGLMLAHDRAIATYDDPREATRSQYWMLVVMVGFTSLGLWLLSAVNR